MSNAQPIFASKVILMFRDLENQNKEDADMLVFQTQHSIKDKAKTNNIETKTGSITVSSTPEITLSFSYLESQDAKKRDIFKKFIRESKTIEIWMINMNEKIASNADGSAKYQAEYSRGVISDLSRSYKVGECVESDVEVSIFGLPQDGVVELNEKTAQKVQYVFESINKKGAKA